MRSLARALTTVAVLVIGALAACGPAATPLNGTRWVLTGIEQGGAARSPLPGSDVTLEFSGGQAQGRASCNSYGGAYTARGSTISFDALAATEMACLDTGLMEQEAVFLGALQAADSFSYSPGELTISGGGTTLRFRPAP